VTTVWVWVLLAAAPVPAQKAQALAGAQSWEELYLAFAAADVKGYSAKDRVTIATELEKGCGALSKTDAVMGYSLGERAVAFHATAGALLCTARTAAASDQRDAAEKALRQGLKDFPKDGAFGLELGKQLLEEKDPAGAAAVLAKVPKKTPQYAEAKRLLASAQASKSEQQAARKEVATIESRIDKGASAEPVAKNATPGSSGSGLGYTSSEGPDGMRTRGNSRFVFKYFNNNRDFGQRADYEGRIVDAMNEIYDFDKQVVGLAREAPCDVILYSRVEFAAHFSALAAMRVAGVYSMNAIRMNDAAEITQETKAVLSHEYVHAIVDDVVHGQALRIPLWMNEGLAEYVEWRYLGSGDPPTHVAAAMHAAAQANELPSLKEMDRGAPINSRNPHIAYGVSAIAVRQLIQAGGMESLWELIREVGKGAAFEPALQKRYGKTVEKLQEEVSDELSGR
jgi:hypothetical protein